MKAAGGPQKLRFTIQSCSGEVRSGDCWLLRRCCYCCCCQDSDQLSSLAQQDTDYPVRELLYHSPQTRGWQSPRCEQRSNPAPTCYHQPSACVPAPSLCAATVPTGSASTLRSWCCAWSGRQRCSRFKYWRMSTRWVGARPLRSCMQCGLAPQAH